MRRLLLWGPPILYMAFIFHLSSESRPLPALTAHVWDKLLHTIEYGASDEYHQSFVPMRDADVHDWFADTAGGSLGAIAYAALHRYQNRRSITKTT